VCVCLLRSVCQPVGAVWAKTLKRCGFSVCGRHTDKHTQLDSHSAVWEGFAPVCVCLWLLRSVSGCQSVRRVSKNHTLKRCRVKLDENLFSVWREGGKERAGKKVCVCGCGVWRWPCVGVTTESEIRKRRSQKVWCIYSTGSNGPTNKSNNGSTTNMTCPLTSHMSSASVSRHGLVPQVCHERRSSCTLIAKDQLHCFIAYTCASN